ncbi:MAG: aspartate-semialdehyde dehydrogenase [Alphaproteobacteria bacterium]|jgi:aspartate-semialdehyde dehydrogenase|nr:aspartate-semialdehyde dehydrogenase [Alphaproteobacteria bacterium]
MDKKYNICIAGATGNVGRELLNLLYERNFPVGEIYPLASERSRGKDVLFGRKKIKVIAIDDFDFSTADIGLFSPGSAVSEEYAPKAAKAGCVVIDNTSFFRMDEDVPLVVPEVNPEAILQYKKKNIIANPNCSTIQMLVALKPLHDVAKIKRVVVCTYQSVSGAGKAAMDELYSQSKDIFMNNKRAPKQFTKQIAFNVIPHIDVFMDDGFTKEEWKMMHETKKILSDDIEVVATCVRCPIFVGHAEAIHVEFADEISLTQAYDAFESAEGIMLADRREDGGYITPVEVVKEDATYISRVRIDPTVKHGLAFWCVADNLRKGAALNTIQIAEKLIKNL